LKSKGPGNKQNKEATIVSTRVQTEDEYLHPNLEFWTKLFANSEHTEKSTFWT